MKKKFLSMVLAVTMALSLVTFQTAAAASKFTDTGASAYGEAIEVITALGIMNGNSATTFNPTGNLSRGAAAKIICNMLLTPEVANVISKSPTKFSDVPESNTYSGYVAWCEDRGIISGYADGTFKPFNTLSGNAFLKMLLGALGYDQNLEGYVGTGWGNNVKLQAVQLGYIDSDFNGGGTVARDYACQLAFLTLQKDMVEYGTTPARGKFHVQSISGTNVTDVNGDGVVQFAEDKFKGLKSSATEDAFGRPGKEWTRNSDANVIASIAYTPVKTYYTNVDAKTIYADLGMKNPSSNCVLYLNGGTKVENITLNATSNTTLSQMAGASSGIIGNGTVVEAYLKEDGAAVLCAITWHAGKVASVQRATVSTERTVTIANAAGTQSVYQTDDYATGDVVAYTYSEKRENGAALGVQDVRELGSIQGKLARAIPTQSMTVGSITYSFLNTARFPGGSDGSLVIGDEYLVYLLTLNGERFAAWVEEVEAVEAKADGYALLRAFNAGNRFNNVHAQARLLFEDGQERTVTLDRVDVDGLAEDILVSYTVKSNEYTLDANLGANAFTASRFDIVNGERNAFNLNGSSADVAVDNNTVFVVMVNNAFRVYTGFRNVPNITGNGTDLAYTYAENGTAKVVYVLGGTLSTTSRDLTFIAANSVSRNVTRDTTDYRTFQAVVNGQITTVRVKADTLFTSTVNGASRSLTVGSSSLSDTDYEFEGAYGPDKSLVLNNTTSGMDGIVSAGSFSSAGMEVRQAVGFSKASSGNEIVIGGASLDLASSVQVYRVTSAGAISRVTVASMAAEDEDDVVIYTYDLDNDVITNLFWLQV